MLGGVSLSARLLGGAAALVTLLVAAPASAMPTPKGPQILDGPTADLVSPVDLQSAVARDGSGGLVYAKNIGGVAHVFLASFVGGVFAPPVPIDAGLAGSSSSPVVGAAPGGELAIAFLSGGALYVVTRAAAGSPLTAPQRLVSAATGPALQMTSLGKAYLAFTVPDGSGSDVRAAYFDGGMWGIEGAPLNATPGDDAGSGAGRPAVTVAGDGVAIIAWGESGHVWARRLWATSPSVVATEMDLPPSGCTETSADQPAIDSGGDSSYASVGFRETVVCGGQTGQRVLASRLRGHQAEDLAAADALGGAGAPIAGNPVVAVGEYGRGWVVSGPVDSGGVAALSLSGNEQPSGSSFEASADRGLTPSYPTAGIAGSLSTLVAWQSDPGTPSGPEIRLRYAEANNTLGPEAVMSSPLQGPADAADGLTAEGNIAGETLVAWVQGAPGARAILVNLLYRAPGAPQPIAVTSRFLRTTRPSFAWEPSNELWGPVTYSVSLDGAAAGQTTATTFLAPAPLGQGPHTWAVSAANPAGLTSAARGGSIFIDTIAPQVTLALSGKRVAHALVHVHLRATDAPAGTSPATASGIVRSVLTWGDGTPPTLTRRFHLYAKPGRYRIRVVVTDAAGNVTRDSLIVRIVAPPKAKKKIAAPPKTKKKVSGGARAPAPRTPATGH